MTVDVDEPAPPAPRGIPFWVKVAAIPAVVLMGTVMFVIGYVLLSDPDPREAATNACMDAVRDQLKAPSTAKFSDVSDLSAGDIAVAVGKSPKPGGDNFFTITGKVEAQNAFGVPLRQSFLCTAQRSGDEWKAEATVF